MKWLIAILLFSNNFFIKDVSAVDVFTHSIENEKQTDFPSIEVLDSDKKAVTYYSYRLEKDDTKDKIIRTGDAIKLPSGTSVKISGYILAKELMESLKFNSIGNKSNEKEIRELLNSGDQEKMYQYMLKVTEKWRTPESDEEREAAEKKIESRKTQDESTATASVPTGYIEVMPEKTGQFKKSQDTRFFIPLEEIKSLKINPQEANFKLRKATTILAFKRLKGALNFPDLSEDDIMKLDRIEAGLISQCSDNCFINQNIPKLGDFVVDSFKVVEKVAKNEDLLIGEEYNQVITVGLKDMIDKVLIGCPSYDRLK